MNRTLRIALVATALAAAGAVAIPSAANAASGIGGANPHSGLAAVAVPSPEGKSTNGIEVLSPTYGDIVSPGQIFSARVSDYVPVHPGDEVTMHIRSISTPLPKCDASTYVGSSALRPDNSFSIVLGRTVVDGLAIVDYCFNDQNIGVVVTVDNPFVLTSPVGDEALAVGATVTGKGSPGATVEATTTDGSSLGSAVVDSDGNWALTFPDDLEGLVSVNFDQGAKHFEGDFVIVAASEGSPIMDPLVGSATALGALGVVALVLRRRRVASAV